MNHDEIEQLQYDIAVLAGCATAYLGDDGNDLDLFEFPYDPENRYTEPAIG